MSSEYIPYGKPLSGIDGSLFLYEESKRLLAVCMSMKACIDVVELRCNELKQEDIIVVDFGDGSVHSHNSVGIGACEKLAITYSPNSNENLCPYEVRALRSSFPQTSHQNHISMGEPASLCLYFESWSTLERSWTPQSHIQRIIWWLKETANGTLHRVDQPLEQLYFSSREKIILPPDFYIRANNSNEKLGLSVISDNQAAGKVVYDGRFFEKSEYESCTEVQTVFLEPVISEVVNTIPHDLGELNEQFSSQTISLIERIKSGILDNSSAELTYDAKAFTLIVLCIPRIRFAGAEVERHDVHGLIVQAGLAKLGLACGVFLKHPSENSVHPALSIGPDTEEVLSNDWKKISVNPVEIALRKTPKYARLASGIAEDGAELKGVLAGVGALGSSLADIWSKEGWGNWTYIDDDYLEPHNIVRHICRDIHVGFPKVDAVKNLTDINYVESQKNAVALNAKVNNKNNPHVTGALSQADLLVDVTTTLEAPRDLSQVNGLARMVSAFLTPSGQASVMLFENGDSSIRLTSLEAQYYRAILSESWGEEHLTATGQKLSVGAGCRDVSVVLSSELIQLHASILARRIRKSYAGSEAKICIWVNDDETGGMSAINITAHETITKQCGDWKVCWDEGFKANLSKLRLQSLPNETGGVLFGYLDHKIKQLHLVHASSAPGDSCEKTTEFVRGKAGVYDLLEETKIKTAGVVSYVGEWHSHPKNSSVQPSNLDEKLLAELSEKMGRDGLPTLMMIIGDNDEISCTLAEPENMPC